MAHLKLLIGCFPAVPLLYRWKHFEEAASYCLRGLIVNRVLVEILLSLSEKSTAEMEAFAVEIDEDDPNASFASRQQVRVCKTVLLLQDPCVDDARPSSAISIFSAVRSFFI